MPIPLDKPDSGAPRARAFPTGLVLTGGGARAAYQVGVLDGVYQILDASRSAHFTNPFQIICGSSAGAINAAALACRADTPHGAMDRLRALWENLSTGMVYRADSLGLVRSGLRWLAMLSVGWLFPGLRNQNPRSLLNNRPLAELLASTLDFERLPHNLSQGYLEALAITASGYTSGEHLTFYQSHHTIQPWRRVLRRAVPCTIGVEHLMASSSIPFVFPAQALPLYGQIEWCGDGSMRQLAPLSPAIHLGARKIFVIGTGHHDDTHPENRNDRPKYPSLAQIGGQALSNIFIDSLSMDLERMGRINELLAHLPPDGIKSQSLHPVRTLAITPSRSLDEIAMEHLNEMPHAARTLFRVLGVSSGSGPSSGGALISYLLFEAGYTQALIRLGRADSLSHVEEIQAFFKEG
ncbi:MAG: patatin-like phospholipase family protein [Candidimonas sp.]|nr:MAG: patatin-like phospholipase family protein [Candidimonas sp.]TAM21648.1 MAG: patatin-like phospholipase family protein [Candidimonas sp.]TAM80744.1 MAG: patatin-like phospholipase family protein [Candidimonas sp.]